MESIVGFADIDEDMIFDSRNTFEVKFIYDQKWITQNLDYSTLLNNFIYLFGFTDFHFISSFPSKEYEISAIENAIIIQGDRLYKKGIYFDMKENAYDLMIIAYYNELQRLNVSLEVVFKWFFEDYLYEQFNINSFKLNIPSEKSSYIEKIRTLCEQIDSILKQFNIFVNEGEINPDLVKITRNTPLFEEISSFNDEKYGYIKDKKLLFIMDLLFSDQSPIAYIQNVTLDYNNFSELIKLGDFKIDDFFDYQKEYIKLLIEEEIVTEQDNNILKLNSDVYVILNYYYQNRVLCLTYYKNNGFLKRIIEQKKMDIEGTLFSKGEVDYLNYILNDRTFDNGLSLRNKYLHGSYYIENDKENEIDYFKILKIFTLLIIKINEEFCRKDDTWINIKENKNSLL